MTADEIARAFTRADGSFLFARWSRPIVPVVFGLGDATLATVKGAIEAMVTLAGHRMGDTDPEQGANLMIFFFRDWSELLELPDLERLVPGLPGRIALLETRGARQYRQFRFEADGAIRACFVFLRIGGEQAEMAAADLALTVATQVMLSWSEGAFAGRGPLVLEGDGAVVRPGIAALIRAAYDPVLPAASSDASHALRLAARMSAAAGASS